uniref:Arginine vasopressin-induced protein 1 n=1 Tax=Sphaeramia orbicularis TaxID=375764 RepID=A0A672YNE6_9TELE
MKAYQFIFSLTKLFHFLSPTFQLYFPSCHRKSGCSNIFTGLNMHQLHRLFRTAGDRDAEHRAKLKESEDREEEAGLAQFWEIYNYSI